MKKEVNKQNNKNKGSRQRIEQKRLTKCMVMEERKRRRQKRRRKKKISKTNERWGNGTTGKGRREKPNAEEWEGARERRDRRGEELGAKVFCFRWLVYAGSTLSSCHTRGNI